MVSRFFRLDIVSNQVSTTNDFTKKEEGIDFSENNTPFCGIRESQVLEVFDLQSILKGLLGFSKLCSGREGHAFFFVYLFGNFNSNLCVVNNRLLKGFYKISLCIIMYKKTITNELIKINLSTANKFGSHYIMLREKVKKFFFQRKGVHCKKKNLCGGPNWLYFPFFFLMNDATDTTKSILLQSTL